MRKQRVTLEDDPEPAQMRCYRSEILAVETDRSGALLEKTGDHLQRRGLAAARRAEKRDELTLLDRQRQAVDGAMAAKILGKAVEDQIAHRGDAVAA